MARDEGKVQDDESEGVLTDPPETEAELDDEDDPLMAEEEVEGGERDWM